MTSRTTTQRTQRERREQTRARLTDAAVQVIAADGYRAATTRRVAEVAGVSLGALAHHFPTREDLIVATLDEVGQRVIARLREDLAGRGGATKAVLDTLWSHYGGELSTVWVKVWLAAAEDPALYARLAPIDRDLNAALARLVDDLAPEGMAKSAWRQRMSVVLNTLRGLSLGMNIEPHQQPAPPDRWPAIRRELEALLDR